jgi:osmotically-inducible protein OsmY
MRTQLLAAAVLSCIGLAACNQQSPSGLPSTPGPTSQAPANGATLGQKVDDAAITAKVKAALLASNDVSGTAISVETNAGRVVLSGQVKDQAQMDRAVAKARNVDGVVDVENRLLVGKG